MNKKRLRYAILKDIDAGKYEDPKLEIDSIPKWYGVDRKEWSKQVGFLASNGYISHPMQGSNLITDVSFVILKEKGENYLDDNSTLAKTYKAAKEIRDWIK